MYYPVGYNRYLMIFLLVTYVMQVDRCSADDDPPPTTDPAAAAADATTAAADATTAATDATTTATDDHPSTFTRCKMDLYKSITDMGQGAGMILKAIGHGTMAVLSILLGSYNGIVLSTAATGDTVAAGLNSVNNAAGSVVLVRDVTSGVSTLATGLATTYRKNAEHNIENRQQLFNTMDSRLDNYHPESEPFLMGSAASQGQTTDTTGAATDTAAADTAAAATAASS